MTRTATWAMLLVVLLAWAVPAAADDRRGGEVGLVVGAVNPDSEMTGDSGTAELVAGLRGGSLFTRHWGWFIDGLYSRISTRTALGDARTVIGRSGMDYLFTPERDARWLISFGAGWMVVDYENAGPPDFHNPLASAGFGQRIRVGENVRLRWELRGDRLLDDARLREKLVQGHALIAVTWGPGGTPREREAAHPPADEDGDGVRDRRDRCPGTPRGAETDKWGCPLDNDHDGVPDGIDRCPRTRAGEQVGPDGCLADSDSDGVPDITDVCPATSEDARVDEWGCPMDSDGDAVPDGSDRCPTTPLGAEVDARGCATDGDGDGVWDGLDRCPETSAGTQVDLQGCGIDTDGDGVRDGVDECPNTARGTAVDSRGCAPAEPLFEEGQTELVLRGVRFETNSAALAPESREVLDRVARSLDADPDVRVEIAGHTDSTGDSAYNLDLSTRRAEAVRDYLIGRGIDGSRLLARGYGETSPIADNTTAQGRAINRRVQLNKY